MKSSGKAVRYEVRLSSADRARCQEVLRGGHCWVWRAKRAQLLLAMDQGKNAREAGESVGVSESASRRIAKRYLSQGLEHALTDDPRPGGKPLLSESEGSAIIAMVCGPPPEGRTRWTLRLIAAESVRRGIVSKVGKETIRILLGCHELKPWREKNVGHPGGHPRIRRPDGRGSGSLPEAA